MRVFLLLLALGAALAFVLIGVAVRWDASAMSLHGWIALGLGAFLSFAVGGGLMALMFYSAREGYDDRVQQDHAPETHDPQ